MRTLLFAAMTLLVACHGGEPPPAAPPTATPAATAGTSSTPSPTPPTGSPERKPDDASPPAASAAPPLGPAPVKRTGKITAMDFGCWADRTCAIRIDDTWVVLPSRGLAREDDVPRGSVIDITMSGAPADDLLKRYVGKRAEVFAAPVQVVGPDGQFGTDPKRLTLEGRADYYVRLLPN